MLECDPPRFSPEQAVRLAREHYGICAAATALPSYLDQNFRISTADSATVLKVTHEGAAPAYVDLQQRILRFLERHGDSLPVPRLIPTSTGQDSTRIDSANGGGHRIWMVSWLPGRVLAGVRPVTPDLMRSLGGYLARLDCALESFADPTETRDYVWDLRNASDLLRYVDCIDEAGRRSLVTDALGEFDETVLPRLSRLPHSVIHHDANDHNVLVSGYGYEAAVCGLLDFGDALKTATIVELAIAATYVMLGRQDPVGVASHLVHGYHAIRPLSEAEIAVIYDLVLARLCSSVLISAGRSRHDPDNAYLRVSERGAWALLESLSSGSADLAEYRWRAACGFEPCPASERLVTWLRARTDTFAPVMIPDVRIQAPVVDNLGVASPLVPPPGTKSDPRRASPAWFRRIARRGAAIGVGRYNEARLAYTADHYRVPNDEYDEWRTIHLGIDLFQEAGSEVHTPLEGHVHSVSFSDAPMDFGGLVLLEHDADGQRFHTLYGHLSESSVGALRAGDTVSPGQAFAQLGTPDENGGWIPHLHFQIVADLLGHSGEFWGVAPASQRAVWLSICPDPNLILGIASSSLPQSQAYANDLAGRRSRCIGGNLSISYRTPLHMVRGFRQYLYDHTGRRYLDAVNNVPHVGHSHPKVNAAAQRQMQVLNTNTRYLHRKLVEYAERLASTVPDPLEVCFFVNSGSEANDLALRLAHAHTGRRDVVVLDGAYHGHLSSLIAVSPYKFDGPGGEGAPPHVHKARVPDSYRGAFRGPQAGPRYADDVRQLVAESPGKIAAFISESLLGCGGQIEPPPGYLRESYAHIRAAGGVCIADEVQVGFGRLGTHFWGFEAQEVVPDIVVLGKPMGNGHPLAGVVTTRAIAQSFDNGMEFFSTFGGNPVSCAVGMAVLDVIEQEGLQEHARRVGQSLLAMLEALQYTHHIVGDVRGRGLFLGVELVRDRESLEPAAAEAAYVANRMAERGVLISTDGPLRNVLKIKPPMVFDEDDASELVSVLDQILDEDVVRRSVRRQ